MFRISLIFILMLLLSSCTKSGVSRDVQIFWKDGENIVVQWRGVIMEDTSILTSAHVVSDDRLRYFIDWNNYIVIKRDTIGDRALLTQDAKQSEVSIDIYPKLVKTGSQVYIQTVRSWSIVALTGVVILPKTSLSAYDFRGRNITLSWVLITDIDLNTGDSGAGIYTIDWKLIDVVHVK